LFFNVKESSAKNKSLSSNEFRTIKHFKGPHHSSDNLLDRVKLSPCFNSSSSLMLNFDLKKRESSCISILNEKKRCSSLIQNPELVSDFQHNFKSMSTSPVTKKNTFKECVLRRINSIFMENRCKLNENNKVMFI